MTEDPWWSIAAPVGAGLLSMRRVAEEGCWDFFWARDSDRRCLLVLRAAGVSMPAARLPHLKGLEIFVGPPEQDGTTGLVIRLLDPTLKDIFLRLCQDIMATTAEAATEPDAVARAVARTWRWHHLLRGGRGLLTPDQQIGLIGELLIIERFLLPKVGAAGAVDSWRGPLGEAQDFAWGRVCIESKARGRGREAEVHISSEQQLDAPQEGTLFLSVSVFDASLAGQEPGFTLTDVAHRVRTRIFTADERAIGRFDALLEAAGLDLSDDYSAWTWVEGSRSIYHVRDEFPRLVPSGMPAGVAKVRYALWLPTCAEFLVPASVFESALEGVTDV